MTKYVTTKANKRLHDRRNCPKLKGAGDPSIREASGQEIEIFDRCKECHAHHVECEFCGETYHINGIGSHKNFCEENPDRIGAKVPVLD